MSEIREMTFRGRKFKVRKGATHPEYSFFCFEADEADFREKYWHPKEDDVVVDAGASYGAYTLTALVMGARVLAFEPEVSVRLDLEVNIALNGFPVLCPRVGLWDSVGVVDMASYAPHWPPGTITGAFDMVTLDSYALAKLDLLKIDTEGCEDRVIRGALETLRRCRPTVIVEVHIFLDPSLLNKCRVLLESCGYSEFEEVPRDPCVMLICRGQV